MGDWGKIAGFFIGGMFGMPLGSPTSMGAGDAIEGKMSGNNSQPPAASPSSEDTTAAIAASENGLKMAHIQSGVMALAIQESSRTSQVQNLAWLTERKDSEATKLQKAEIEAKTRFTKESDRHIEKMTEYRNKFVSQETYGGLPPPDEN